VTDFPIDHFSLSKSQQLTWGLYLDNQGAANIFLVGYSGLENLRSSNWRSDALSDEKTPLRKENFTGIPPETVGLPQFSGQISKILGLGIIPQVPEEPTASGTRGPENYINRISLS